MNFWKVFTFWTVLAIQLSICLSQGLFNPPNLRNPTSKDLDLPKNSKNSKAFWYYILIHIHFIYLISVISLDTNSNEVTTISTTDNIMRMIRSFINNFVAIFTGRNTPETESRSGQSIDEELFFKIPLVNVEVCEWKFPLLHSNCIN